MSHTPSPITPTEDQAFAIAYLEAAGAVYGVDVDAAPLDEIARALCEDDFKHGPGVVCTPGKWRNRLCLACAVNWLQWYPGELVSPEVLQLPTTAARAA